MANKPQQPEGEVSLPAFFVRAEWMTWGNFIGSRLFIAKRLLVVKEREGA
ncbi:hypothetical protein ACHHV8_35800 [Paenibacillus sp. TAB 01]